MAERPTTWSVVDTGTDSALTATQPGASGLRHYIAAVSISASAAPLAAAVAELKRGATVVDSYILPPGAFAPIVINFDHPFRCGENEDAELTLEALGAGIDATIVIKGFTVSAN